MKGLKIMTKDYYLKAIDEVKRNEKYDCLVEYLSKEKDICFNKFNQHLEYEMKLDYHGEEADLDKIFEQLTMYLSMENIYIDSVGRFTDYDVEYFTNGTEELSLFIYENEPLLKIKKHKKKIMNDCTIFCNEEDFEYNSVAIKEILSRDNVVHVASMNKKRIKDFLICKEHLMIYASALTLCSINNNIQIQYELEYYRHLPVSGIEVDESLILSQLSKLCNSIIKNSKNTFIYGTELKCDFAKKHHFNNKTKVDAIDNILNLKIT